SREGTWEPSARKEEQPRSVVRSAAARGAHRRVLGVGRRQCRGAPVRSAQGGDARRAAACRAHRRGGRGSCEGSRPYEREKRGAAEGRSSAGIRQKGG